VPLRRSARVALLIAAFAASGLSGYFLEGAKYSYSHSWSMADPLCGFLALVTLGLTVGGKWRLDAPAWWMAAYVGMYAFSMTLNATWGSGTALNFFRTAAWSAVLYVVVCNALFDTRDLKWFYWLATFVGLSVTLNGLFVIVKQWSVRFTNVIPVLGGSTNTLNSWGFVLVMFLAIAVAWWLQSPATIYRAMTCVVMAAGVALSLSRTAYTCLALILLFAAASARRRNVAIIVLVVSAMGGALWVTISQSGEAVPAVAKFMGHKAATYKSDLNDTRLDALTIDPLMAWVRERPRVWIIGDGVSQQHNLLINCLWMTGIIGTFVMVGYHVAIFQKSLKLWRAERRVRLALANLGPMFFALILVMLLDDLLTNLRNHSSVVAYTFAVLAGGLSSPGALSNCRHSITPRIAALATGGGRIQAGLRSWKRDQKLVRANH